MARTPRDRIEDFVKGRAFSVLCFLIWGSLTVLRARKLVHAFAWIEVAWLAYNATLAILFLVRTRPSDVSLNPVEWLVALTTSFSGLFFESKSAGIAGTDTVADGMIWLGLLGSFVAALSLRRNYDFLPARRGLTTSALYRWIRHPMYLFSIDLRLGYLLRHASAQNAALMLVVIWLYDRRARYEEKIMSADARYRAYLARVPWRFLPGVY